MEAAIEISISSSAGSIRNVADAESFRRSNLIDDDQRTRRVCVKKKKKEKKKRTGGTSRERTG